MKIPTKKHVRNIIRKSNAYNMKIAVKKLNDKERSKK